MEGWVDGWITKWKTVFISGKINFPRTFSYYLYKSVSQAKKKKKWWLISSTITLEKQRTENLIFQFIAKLTSKAPAQVTSGDFVKNILMPMSLWRNCFFGSEKASFSLWMFLWDGKSLEEKGKIFTSKNGYVYANLTKSVTKIVFTKQLRSEIFRSLVISFCITCEFVKLIVIKLTNFSLQHGMVRIISCITIL